MATVRQLAQPHVSNLQMRQWLPVVFVAILTPGLACTVGDETGDSPPSTGEQVDDPSFAAAPLVAGRGTCEVKVNGRAIRKLTASSREDCYAMTSFGSANCQAYAPYLRYGVDNVIQQVFNGNDQVNLDTCALAPSCVVKINGATVTTMSAPDRNTCYNQTSYGSDTCAAYARYFRSGKNLVEQYFAGTDRVNNDTCFH